jgi:integrase
MVDFHLLWGPRPSESAELKLKDVELHDAYIVIYIPQKKTIPRPVPIPLGSESVIRDPTFLDSALNAYTSLMQYLNSHPGYPDDGEYPLWYDEKKGRKHLDPYSMSRFFKRIGKQAGIKKNVSTYVLRRTAFNRFKGVNREMLCAGFGWKPGSKMPTQVYNKLRPKTIWRLWSSQLLPKKEMSYYVQNVERKILKIRTSVCGVQLLLKIL